MSSHRRTKPKTRVVVVDDSSLSRAILREVLQADGDIEVVGEAENGYEAVGVVDALGPDVVTMDIDMPGPSGLDTIGWIIEKSPLPILVVTGERLGDGSALGFHAIERGAADFAAKPSIDDDAALVRLRAQVRAIAGLAVGPRNAAPALLEDAQRIVAAMRPREGVDVLGFSSGIGGHRTLMRILRRLPPLPCAIVVSQHMAPRFGVAFARYLQRMTPLRVQLASTEPMPLTHGSLWVCDARAHLVCPKRGEIVALEAPPDAGYRPSGTRLFESLARTYGRGAIGVLCAGSGDDGASGLRAMRDAGALTVVESPETAVPADMPRAAVAAEAAARTLPAELIADYLASAFADPNKSTAPPSLTGG